MNGHWTDWCKWSIWNERQDEFLQGQAPIV